MLTKRNKDPGEEQAIRKRDQGDEEKRGCVHGGEGWECWEDWKVEEGVGGEGKGGGGVEGKGGEVGGGEGGVGGNVEGSE